MAAQNLTAAGLLDVQARLTALLAQGEGPSSYELVSDFDIQTARAMLLNHRANVSPLTDANGNCRSFLAYHLEGRGSGLAYNGDGDDLTLTCDIPSGDGLVAKETPYNFNVRKVNLREAHDDLCGNLFRDGVSADTRQEAATIVARNLLQGVQEIHRELNLTFINFLDSSKTPINNDTDLPSGLSYNGGANEFEIDETVLSTLNPDTLTQIETVAQNNDLPTNWFIIAGRNHYRNAAINSQWKVLNDNQRSEVRWQDSRLFFDQKHLDKTLTGRNSFVVDPSAYIFYDHVDPALTFDPFQVDFDKWEFVLEDPSLMVNTPSGMRPLRYTVHYQKICASVNTARMRNTFTHRFRIILNCGLHQSPPAWDGHTGILKFVTG